MNALLNSTNVARSGTASDDTCSVQRRFGRLHIAMPALSIYWIVAGIGLGVDRMAQVGGIGLAATIFCIGALAVRERRILVWQQHVSNRVAIQVVHGAAAVPMGLAGMLGGLTLFALVIAHAQGVSVDAMRGLLFARPGLALAPVGALLLLMGAGFVLGCATGNDSDKGTVFNAALSIPSRMGGLILLVSGGVVAGLGAFELLQPDSFDHVLAAFFGANPRPALTH